jgi:hypothetical protein
MIAHSYRLPHCVIAAAALTLGACNGETATSVLEVDHVSQSIAARVGQEVDITLGTVGPGEYASIPSISSPAVRFLDVSDVGPYVPAGVRQRFRFTARASGVAIITFRHSGTNPVVTDTVAVR